MSKNTQALLALAQRHGLADAAARELTKNFTSLHFRNFCQHVARCFVELHPWIPGEPSLWFQVSDRAHQAVDAFWSEVLQTPSLVAQLEEVPYSSPSNATLSLLMETAMRRNLPQTARQIGQRVEAMEAERRQEYVGVFMDFYTRFGYGHNAPLHGPNEGHYPPLWWILWDALGPQSQADAARPQHWSGFFESPSGSVPGSQILSSQLSQLTQLSFALEHCPAAAPLLRERLSRPETHAALAEILARMAGQLFANEWKQVAVDLLALLDRFETNLDWKAPQLSALAQAAQIQHSKPARNRTPHLDAWIEKRILARTMQPSQEPDAHRSDTKRSPSLPPLGKDATVRSTQVNVERSSLQSASGKRAARL